VDSAPIWSPKLPPLEAIITGGLHGPLKSSPVRQVMTPRPYCPPTIKPAFFILGMTMTHLVPSSTLPGMPLSGASMISFMTFDASLTLSFSFSPDSAQHEPTRPRPTNNMLVIFFMANLAVILEELRRGRLHTAPLAAP